jgi:CRISPR system Cascade subunit CasB
MSTIVFQEHKFIGHLEKLVKEQDRGALAALRRGLGKPPGTVREMDTHVLPYLPPDTSEKQENAYYLVGALFAYWHQGKDTVDPNPPVNIGASLYDLVKQDVAADTSNQKLGDKWKNAEKRVEKRLIALLNCHQDDLPDHLRHTISLLKTKDIPVKWLQLLNHIQNWQRESRDVQRSWARQFWRFSSQDEPADNKA